MTDMIEKKGEALGSEELLDIIENDLKNARELHDEQLQRIQEWVERFEGEPYGNEVDGKSKIVWKLGKKQGNILVSNLIKPFIATPEIVNFTPRTYKDVHKAHIYEKVVNHFWSNDFDHNKFLKDVGKVMVKEGTAIVRCGWEKVDKTETFMVPQLAMDVRLKMIEQGYKVEEQNPGGPYKITKPNIVVNRPTAKLLRNEDVYIDPTADSFDEIQYLIYEYVVTLSDLKSQPHLYDQEAVKKLEKIMDREDDIKRDDQIERYTDSVSDDKGMYNPSNAQFIDKTRRKVRIYEYWGVFDMDGDGINEPIVASVARYTDDSDGVILRMERNPFPLGKIPFIIIPLYDVEYELYGSGIMDLVDDEQRVMTAIVRGIIDNMAKSNNGQTFFKKNALDVVNLNRLRRGDPFVEINTTDSINNAVTTGNFNQLPPALFNFWSIVDQQSEVMTGVLKTMQGLPGSELKASTSNFATMMSQSQIRLLDITNNLTSGLKKMFMMWTYMAMENLSDDEIQDITGINLAELKVKESKKLQLQFGLIDPSGQPTVDQDTFDSAMILIFSEIQDMFDTKDVKFDIDLRVGTDGLKQIRIQQLSMFMQQAAPLVEVGAVDPESIKKLIAKLAENMDMPDIAHDIRTYTPKPDPVQQQMMQLEMALKAAEVKKSEALAANAMARTQNVAVKTQKDAVMTDAELAGKYADAAGKIAKTRQDEVKTKADAVAKLKQASKPDQSQSKGGKAETK